MAQTKFSGPVVSTNGFVGNVSATVLTCTSLTVGTTKIGTVINAASGLVSAQTGYIQVLVGATTAYIALYKSLTV
jgi:hypothetical protein